MEDLGYTEILRNALNMIKAQTHTHTHARARARAHRHTHKINKITLQKWGQVLKKIPSPSPQKVNKNIKYSAFLKIKSKTNACVHF